MSHSSALTRCTTGNETRYSKRLTLTVQSVRGRFRWDSYYSRDRGDSSPTSTVERTWNLEQANHARRSAAAPEVRRASCEAGTAVIQVPLNP